MRTLLGGLVLLAGVAVTACGGGDGSSESTVLVRPLEQTPLATEVPTTSDGSDAATPDSAGEEIAPAYLSSDELRGALPGPEQLGSLEPESLGSSVGVSEDGTTEFYPAEDDAPTHFFGVGGLPMYCDFEVEDPQYDDYQSIEARWGQSLEDDGEDYGQTLTIAIGSFASVELAEAVVPTTPPTCSGAYGDASTEVSDYSYGGFAGPLAEYWGPCSAGRYYLLRRANGVVAIVFQETWDFDDAASSDFEEECPRQYEIDPQAADAIVTDVLDAYIALHDNQAGEAHPDEGSF